MITNSGKKIISKYLLGQTAEYAGYIAVGCGTNALTPSQTLSAGKTLDIKSKTNLDFEMFRVPITAKGFIKENGEEKLVFKAEMPTEQRYQITEISIFPGATNTLAGPYSSKSLATFIPNESWVIGSAQSSSAIATVTDAAFTDVDANIAVSGNAYYIPSDSTLFDNVDRKDRQEPPRFYNRALMVSGKSSYIDSNGSTFGNYVQNSTLAFNFGQNLPADDIRIAISLVSRLRATDTNPTTTRIVVELINNIVALGNLSPKARAVINLADTDFVDSETSSVSRYYVIRIPLSDFALDDGFSWSNINLIRLYATVEDDFSNSISVASLAGNVATLTMPGGHNLYPGMKVDVTNINAPYTYFNGTNFTVSTVTDTTITFTHSASVGTPVSASVSGNIEYTSGTGDYKIIFDGMRLENNTTENPLYSLVAYDIIVESSGYPVLKTDNSNNYIEYRLAVGVQDG